MRLLHTGDWHASRTLARQSLDDGLQKALETLVDYAISERVDAVLVAGDIFESARPLGTSQEIVYETLLRLWKADIPAVLIAGNHDSFGHWTALKPLLKLANVSVVARPALDSVLTIPTRSGPLELTCLAWPTERLLAPLVMRQGEPGDDEAIRMTWAQRVHGLIEALCQRTGDTGPRVFLSHLMINGSRIPCTQRPLSISDCYAISAELFPADWNYVALGHVHQPQSIAAKSKAHYAGAPRPMDFGEAGELRGFCRVDLERGRHTEVELIPIDPAQPLTVVRVPLAGLEQAFDEHRGRPGFIKVQIEVEQRQNGLADRVRKALPNALIVEALLQGTSAKTASEDCRSLLDPRQTFRDYYLEHNKTQLPDELERAFQEMYEEVQHATSQA